MEKKYCHPVATCDGCGAEIIWVGKNPCNPAKKKVVLQVRDLPLGMILPVSMVEGDTSWLNNVIVVTGRESHFSSCPKAEQFRKSRKEKP